MEAVFQVTPGTIHLFGNKRSDHCHNGFGTIFYLTSLKSQRGQLQDPLLNSNSFASIPSMEKIPRDTNRTLNLDTTEFAIAINGS